MCLSIIFLSRTHLITCEVQTKVSDYLDLYDQQHLGLISSNPWILPNSPKLSGFFKMVHFLAYESIFLNLINGSLGCLIQIL
jgi:hypothetical protein